MVYGRRAVHGGEERGSETEGEQIEGLRCHHVDQSAKDAP
jgi:hypothetical protein